MHIDIEITNICKNYSRYTCRNRLSVNVNISKSALEITKYRNIKIYIYIHVLMFYTCYDFMFSMNNDISSLFKLYF